MITAYQEWKNAGADFAWAQLGKKKGIVELGEASFVYANARPWCAHKDIIRRAFSEGYDEAIKNIEGSEKVVS